MIVSKSPPRELQRYNFDSRLEEFAKNNPQYADANAVEQAIETDPEIWQNRTSGLIPAPYKNIIIERALCIEAIKCPIPLPWSSWRFLIKNM